MNKNIFIACDTTEVSKVKKIIKHTSSKTLKVGYKFGLEFLNSKNGRYFVSKLKKKIIFADLKLNDIPNTSASAIFALRDLKNISYLTVHINGGLEMLKAIRKACKKTHKKLKILGVTILTSFSNSTIKKIGHTKSIKELVKKQSLIAKLAKLDGIVCSGHEAKMLKNICRRMEIFTPGIRLKGDKINDQKRVITPKEAIQNESYWLVLGRPITKVNIKNNLESLINHLK